MSNKEVNKPNDSQKLANDVSSIQVKLKQLEDKFLIT